MAKSNFRPTRKLLNCPVFGSPSQLHVNMLPTYEDVMKYYICIKNGLKLHAGGQFFFSLKIHDIYRTNWEFFFTGPEKIHDITGNTGQLKTLKLLEIV